MNDIDHNRYLSKLFGSAYYILFTGSERVSDIMGGSFPQYATDFFEFSNTLGVSCESLDINLFGLSGDNPLEIILNFENGLNKLYFDVAWGEIPDEQSKALGWYCSYLLFCTDTASLIMQAVFQGNASGLVVPSLVIEIKKDVLRRIKEISRFREVHLPNNHEEFSQEFDFRYSVLLNYWAAYLANGEP